ncbi:hypothetical protein IQ06DRAFT_68372 [Phaeosphaeriaceae sp. SRC1lsM3a]|nr:hypothetical protein IQ06DRAFT_68372 [Stagonospora sp. SRC1lsM3a]
MNGHWTAGRSMASCIVPPHEHLDNRLQNSIVIVKGCSSRNDLIPKAWARDAAEAEGSSLTCSVWPLTRHVECRMRHPNSLGTHGCTSRTTCQVPVRQANRRGSPCAATGIVLKHAQKCPMCRANDKAAGPGDLGSHPSRESHKCRKLGTLMLMKLRCLVRIFIA